MNADTAIHAGLFGEGEHCVRPLDTGRLTYVHMARGSLNANGHALVEGDGVLLDGEPELKLENGRNAEVLVFDLAR